MNYYTILWLGTSISEHHQWATDQWGDIWNWWVT